MRRLVIAIAMAALAALIVATVGREVRGEKRWRQWCVAQGGTVIANPGNLDPKYHLYCMVNGAILDFR